MKVKKLSKFTLSVYRPFSPHVIEALKECSIGEFYLEQARAIVSVEKKSLLFGTRKDIMENIIDVYSFTTPPESESIVFSHFINNLGLNQEGRGSIFAEPAVSIEDTGMNSGVPDDILLSSAKTKWMGIYCIIQRGRGELIAKAALDHGICVPAVYYGVGGGVRDRMGLIRITIPAEKEMINLIVTEHDCQGLLNILIDAGNLDRPGMGFIFDYPVSSALIDTRSYIGTNMSAASSGQIINAIDEIKGNSDWRKRHINPLNSKKRKFLNDLEDIILTCKDEKAREMLNVAMSAGAAGATISHSIKAVFSPDLKTISKSPVEVSDMVVDSSVRKPVISALKQAGFFTPEVGGSIMIKKSVRAFSYFEKRTPYSSSNPSS